MKALLPVFLSIGVLGQPLPAYARPKSSGYLDTFPMSGRLAKSLFESAKAEWMEIYTDEKLISWLEAISEDGSKHLTEERIEEIRRSRVLVQRLRSLYFFLDRRHMPPEDFNEFVKKLGKLKDAIQAGEKIRKKTKKVLGVIEATQPIETMVFIPTDRTSFVLFAKQHLKDIMELAEQDVLSFDDHHTLRKNLRDFMNLTRLLKKTNPSESLLELFTEMKAVDTLLGSAHDALEIEILQSTSRSEKEAIEATRIQVEPRVKDLAVQLYEFWMGEKPKTHEILSSKELSAINSALKKPQKMSCQAVLRPI
ncbi:MAG: hypothetical protein AB7F59_13570 [Bdellovibrionales bacterium]